MPRSERAKFERKTSLQDDNEYNLHTSAGSPITSGALESVTLLTGSSGPDSDDNPLAGVYFDDEERNNEVLKKWMWFDLRIESIQVTLNLVRWLDGKGLVQDADVQGVRGVVGKCAWYERKVGLGAYLTDLSIFKKIVGMLDGIQTFLGIQLQLDKSIHQAISS
jgi:Yeast mitochondrial distribution and morphology (MDM) proteins